MTALVALVVAVTVVMAAMAVLAAPQAAVAVLVVLVGQQQVAVMDRPARTGLAVLRVFLAGRVVQPMAQMGPTVPVEQMARGAIFRSMSTPP